MSWRWLYTRLQRLVAQGPCDTWAATLFGTSTQTETTTAARRPMSPEQVGDWLASMRSGKGS